MPAAATIDPPIDDSLLDELVPPPGPRWQRAVLWLAFLGIVGACTWAATTGRAIPQVSTSVQMWGGTDPVGITSSVTNTSPVPIEIVGGPRSRPGLDELGAAVGPVQALDRAPTEPLGDPFPIRIEPDESIDLTFWFQIEDCDAIEAISTGDDAIDLQVRIASGPASRFTAERTIAAGDLSMEPGGPVSWPAAVAAHACPA